MLSSLFGVNINSAQSRGFIVLALVLLGSIAAVIFSQSSILAPSSSDLQAITANHFLTQYSGAVGTLTSSASASTVPPQYLGFRVYMVTAPVAMAKDLARKLVEHKLAACVNLANVDSVYSWKGKIVEDEEMLLLIKTHSSLHNDITSFILSNHPYTVPEIISVPIDHGHPAYLSWIHDNIMSSSLLHKELAPHAQTQLTDHTVTDHNTAITSLSDD